MSENTARNISIDLTDDEFVRLHAAASADGLEVNDFIVATLRKHARIAEEIETLRQDDSAPET
ncbi:hypothetical protein JIN84_15925 [Luteolibacter yonseiensis]|uniref:Uncharacterized protein n=1 Tax=Luteolibacter yonseiensis TaxID=1144680 RepID=A0A934R6Z4_9BACT|nr:hypothetical protein [Luteolibacter yonseiensis]MBK1817108.1 hypothetical protein [Luteolibacter yonseiensis]